MVIGPGQRSPASRVRANDHRRAPVDRWRAWGPRNGLRPRRVIVPRSVPPLHTKRRRASARSGTDQPIHPCAQRESNSYPEVPCERRPRPAECAPFRTERGWVRARSGTDQPIPPRAQRESNSFSEVPCGRRPEPAECTPPPYGAGLGQSPLWNRSTNPPSRTARKQFLPRGSLRATAQARGVCPLPYGAGLGQSPLWNRSTNPPSRAARKQFLLRGSLRTTARARGVYTPSVRSRVGSEPALEPINQSPLAHSAKAIPAPRFPAGDGPSLRSLTMRNPPPPVATLWSHSTRQMPEPLVIWPMIHAGCLAALIAFSTASARSASTTTVMPMPMLNT